MIGSSSDDIRVIPIECGTPIPIPDYLNVTDGDFISAGEFGTFKVAQSGDWVFGKVDNNKIITIYCFKLHHS